MNEALLLLSLCLLLIGFAVVRGHVQRWLTKVVFRRPDVDRALREIESRGALPGEELAFVTWAGEYLAQFFRADRVELVPEQRLNRVPELSGLMFPAPASDVPALRHMPEFAWAEAIAPLPGAQGESRFLLLGRRRGGRRYLSEDLQALSRLTAAVVAQIERFRNSEMQRLVSQAELRALQAQINPHFLFNALNTLYGIIPRNAPAPGKRFSTCRRSSATSCNRSGRSYGFPTSWKSSNLIWRSSASALGPRLETRIEVDEAR